MSGSCIPDCLNTRTLTAANVQTASASWGALVLSTSNGALGFDNLGGCITTLDPSTSGKECATAIDANMGWKILACSGCAVPYSDVTDAELNDYSDL